MLPPSPAAFDADTNDYGHPTSSPGRFARAYRSGRERIAETWSAARRRARTVRRRLSGRLQRVDARDVTKRLKTVDPSAVRKQLRQIDSGFIDRGAQTIDDADLQRVVDGADAIDASFRRDGPLARLIDDGRLLLSLVRDAVRGTYRDVPRWSLGAAAFALLYVLNPLDLIPDAIPGIGALDDAGVVSLCLLMIEQDLLTYREWRVNAMSADSPRELTDRGNSGPVTES